jgi:hypothetical protein
MGCLFFLGGFLKILILLALLFEKIAAINQSALTSFNSRRHETGSLFP